VTIPGGEAPISGAMPDAPLEVEPCLAEYPGKSEPAAVQVHLPPVLYHDDGGNRDGEKSSNGGRDLDRNNQGEQQSGLRQSRKWTESG
jgi:hypothetical protein